MSQQQDFPDLVDLENPDVVPAGERTFFKMAKEDIDLDRERFVGDLLEAEEVSCGTLNLRKLSH